MCISSGVRYTGLNSLFLSGARILGYPKNLDPSTFDFPIGVYLPASQGFSTEWGLGLESRVTAAVSDFCLKSPPSYSPSSL